MDAKLELVKGWLHKAQRDLESAQWLAASPDPYLDTAIYHCQQAAEKAIKGWLTFHDQRFEKTHDLRLLVHLAIALEPQFIEHLDAAELLTPYATAFRYPGEPHEPEPEEFEEALQAAKILLRFIYDKLPSEVQVIPESQDPSDNSLD